MMSALRNGAVALEPVRGLGLGCNRFGSVLDGADQQRVETLVETALDNGIRYFDTADIYGQGESEIMLGRALRRRAGPYMIGTKVGQRFPLWQRALRTFKAPLKHAVGSVLRKSVASIRERPLPRCYEPRYVTTAVERSLRRLGMDAVDIAYLHSPPADVLKRGIAVEALDRLRTAGKIKLIGVSCDDLESARHVLADDRIQILQVPLISGDRLADLLSSARAKGMGIVGHSAFRLAHQDQPALSSARRGEIVRDILGRAEVDVLLVGTTNPGHLRELAVAAGR